MINANRINQSNGFNRRLMAPEIKREYSALEIKNSIQGTGDMGTLIPTVFKELLPGEKINLKQSIGFQFMPFVSNLLHEITGSTMYYFVPYRLVWDKWEDFITGGKDGLNNDIPPKHELVLGPSAEGTLQDYFGMPLIEKGWNSNTSDMLPVAFPWRAYNTIYNEHIRIPDLEDEIDIDSNEVRRGYWQWDYYTRARIYQQRGNIPTVPISDVDTVLKHEFQLGTWDSSGDRWSGTDDDNYGRLFIQTQQRSDSNEYSGGLRRFHTGPTGSGIQNSQNKDTLEFQHWGETNLDNNDFMPNIRLLPHTVEGLGVNMNDFLVALGIMRFQVNNAKIEAHYSDHLNIRWGVYPEDARLQKPEYLGAEKIEITTETVTQTAPGNGDQTKQGNITGQAWAIGAGGVEYEATEHGILMGITCVRPASVYEGGLNRMWIKNNKFDFPTPELMNLPDVPIYTGELCYRPKKDYNEEVFGYQGIYEEYRTLPNIVCGRLRPSNVTNDNLVSYTLARYFESPPNLNLDFLQCKPDKNRIMAYPNEPTFIYIAQNNFHSAIPLPVQSEPAALINI